MKKIMKKMMILVVGFFAMVFATSGGAEIHVTEQTKTYTVPQKIETVEPVKGFKAPKVDSDIELELKDGRIIKGKCNKITQDKIYMDVDEGIIGYSRNDLSSNSRCKVFKPDYEKKMSDIKKDYEKKMSDIKKENEKESARQASLQAAAQLQSVTQAAEHGNAEAQFTLGLYYCKGEFVTKNEVEAVKWWRKAAEQGYLRAQCELANCYAFGKYIAQDKAEAVKWYRKAAEQGNADAQYAIGTYCADMEKNSAEAVKWYRKAAEQGHAEAKAALEKLKYEEAAERGNDHAQYKLAECYFDGYGVAQNRDEAVKWWRKAAEQGNTNAQYKLAQYYMTQDEAEALKWLHKAAKGGHAQAQILCKPLTSP